MSDTTAFAPIYTVTGTLAGTNAGTLLASLTVAATAASQAFVLPGNPVSGQFQIQIANQSTVWAFVNFGIAGAVVAATVAASYPVGPGVTVVVGVAEEVTGGAIILASTTGNVTFTRGNGL